MQEELKKLKNIRDSLISKSKNKFSSHPGDNVRIKNIEKMIQSIEYGEFDKEEIENFLKPY